MRRVVAAIAAAVLAMATAACGSNNEQKIYTTDASEVVPSSGTFGQPITTSVGSGSLQLLVQPLRLETNDNAQVPEEIAIVDVVATADFGSTFIDPTQFHVYAPDGTEFAPMESPELFLANPLVRTDLTQAGQQVTGSVAFVVPGGIRIGRLDFISDSATVSFTVVRQPVNTASATTTTSSDTAETDGNG